MNEDLDVVKDHALSLMKDEGFPLEGDVEVVLDQDLPYMGYTTQREGKSVIVVSGMALSSGGALNLMIHEMSHVYFTQTGHPSHDYQLLSRITGWVMQGRVVTTYKENTIKAIINHIQDLYADDISFKIFKTSQEDLAEFFMGWIHKPVKSVTEEDRWINAGHLLSAAFAQANLEKHNIEDKEGKVAKAIQEFLSKIDKKQAEKYEYFKKFMVTLPEELNEKEFEKLLIEYLGEFLKLTKL